MGGEMARISEARELSEQTTIDATMDVARANMNTLNFLFGAQRLLLAEFLFASNEMFERSRSEMHLFAEFVAKMAGAHSVKGVREMVHECARHQIDFVR